MYDLDLKDFCNTVTLEKEGITVQPVFDLCGVINHVGDLEKGHYTAFVKNGSK